MSNVQSKVFVQRRSEKTPKRPPRLPGPGGLKKWPSVTLSDNGPQFVTKAKWRMHVIIGVTQLLRQTNWITGKHPGQVVAGWTVERAITDGWGPTWPHGPLVCRKSVCWGSAEPGDRERGTGYEMKRRVPVSNQCQCHRDDWDRFEQLTGHPRQALKVLADSSTGNTTVIGYGVEGRDNGVKARFGRLSGRSGGPSVGTARFVIYIIY